MPGNSSKAEKSESPSPESSSEESSPVRAWTAVHGAEPSEVVLLALVAVSFPVVTDADAEARALGAVVVELSTVWGRLAGANVGQVGPASFILVVAFFADDSGILEAIFVISSGVVRLIQNIAKFHILKNGELYLSRKSLKGQC